MMETFRGVTLVAFIDISGFKSLMKKENVAYRVMRRFYSTGFQVLRDQQEKTVSGFFVSDCGILFACKGKEKQKIESLLNVVKEINIEMLRNDIMLTTSIAYGKFSYTNLTEHKNIEKLGLFGDAYLNAYIDSEVTKPKMTPGQCRIIIKDLPSNYKNLFETNKLCIRREEFNLPTIEIKLKDKYFYYYWMINQNSSVTSKLCKDFERDYTNCYKFNTKYKYLEMKKVLINTLNQNFPIFSFNYPLDD